MPPQLVVGIGLWLACSFLALLILLQLHGVLDNKCYRARHRRLRTRNEELQGVNDAVASANFEEVKG